MTNDLSVNAAGLAALSPHFAAQREKIDQTLDRLLPSDTEYPQSIHEAIRYSVFAGGKRVRPLLLLETGEAFGGEEECLLQAAAAVEMLHTYSLIHDDLPAMDDDTLRRGMPTSHVKFGEATAILAGDALSTLAFQVLANLPVDPPRVLQAIRTLATAGGTLEGMIAGQVMDLKYEGRSLDLSKLEQLHRAKTGALIRASIRIGALLAGAGATALERLDAIGARLGLVFQVMDDILDVESTPAQLGKTPGKDRKAKKYTFADALGPDQSRRYAQRLTDEALAELEQLDADTSKLKDLCLFLLHRRS
ncbi:MAG TPA: farnesyl diphosphate synthase [Acidobacteriota bacterium]|jgi:geranylgeranyl pyrophosphate synthase